MSFPIEQTLRDFQSQLKTIEQRGQKLEDFEIQRTKSGFLLRQKDSWITKLSKFFFSEEYDAAKNIEILARAAMTAAFTQEANIDIPQIQKALKSLNTDKTNTTKVAIRAIGIELNKERTLVTLLDSLIKEMKNDPINVFFDNGPQIQKALEAYRESDPEGFADFLESKSMKEIQQSFFDLFLDKRIKNPKRFLSIAPAALKGPNTKKFPNFDATKASPLYTTTYRLCQKWLPKFTNFDAVYNTLAREDLGAMRVNGKRMQGAIDVYQKLEKSCDPKFLDFAKITLMAETLFQALKKAHPEKQATDLEKEVIELMGLTPIDYNSVSTIQETLQPFAQLIGTADKSDFNIACSSSIGSKQPAIRYEFTIQQRKIGMTTRKIYQLKQENVVTDEKRLKFLEMSTSLTKQNGKVSYDGALSAKERAPIK